jgi:hypothetical protein
MMTRDEIADWATAYIEAQMIPKIPADHPLWWAIERFMLPVGTDVTPEDCWMAILEVLSREPPQQVIGILAAGALEDLIQYHGPEFIERIETESRRNAAFRHLLGGVWKSSTPEVWSRVEEARGDPW